MVYCFAPIWYFWEWFRFVLVELAQVFQFYFNYIIECNIYHIPPLSLLEDLFGDCNILFQINKNNFLDISCLTKTNSKQIFDTFNKYNISFHIFFRHQ